jgi:D-alanyl-D-alanine carboxypeptidase
MGMKRRLLLVALIILVLSVLAALFFQKNKVAAPAPNAQQSAKPAATSSTSTEEKQPAFNKSQYSLTDPTSIWFIVNKQRRLQPAEYVPDGLVVPNIRMKSGITSDENRLRKDAATALESLNKAANEQSIALTMQSGYRSYTYQDALYSRYVREQGQSVADTQSARPGYSEHQTGLSADLGGKSNPACNVEDCYKDTAEGKWIAANAYKYGFVVRYPEGKQAVTGYIYEPWHLRYVGTALATQMHDTGTATLEEFFGLPAAPDYK